MRLAALFHTKSRLWVEGRQNWQAVLTQKLAGNSSPIVWFHAASLGEFEQGRPVIEAFRKEYPAYKILLTFFSPSGYEIRKEYDGADYIVYLPADTPDNARQFIRLVKPSMAFFIKYEFWYNYLHELKLAGIPTLSFSAIFRPGQLFFKPYGGFYRDMLYCFDHILVQNQQSVDLLKSVDITNVTLAGDTRFDRVAEVASARKDIPIAAAFKGSQPVLVIGSAWPEDMDVLIPFLNTFDQPLKAIIAPHEIDTDQIERWRVQLVKPSIRYSDVLSDPSIVQPSAHLLFIDNIGMLSSLYQYGEFAYIGGAFKQGLHNILEAATFGMPLFFGPDYDKYQEAVDLVNAGAAFPVSNQTELATAFASQYTDPLKASEITRTYVARNIGATLQVMQVVKRLLMRERVDE